MASASRLRGSASTTSTAEPCSSATGPECPSTPTCESSEPTRQPLTCSTADTPVSRSASPGSAKGPTTPGTSGPSSPDSFAFYDPESLSLRTSQATFDLGFTPSLPTLPAWGWMSGGELYELPMSAPLTDESVYSSLLPTPVSQDVQKQPEAHLAKKVESGAGETITSLTVMTRQYAATGEWSNKLLPTPTRRDEKGRNQRNDDSCLPGAVMLLPTRDSGEFQSLARAAYKLLPTPRGGSQTETVALLPTPAAADGERGPDYAAETREGTGGDSLVTTIAAMRGELTATPFAAGSESVASLLDPPTKEAA